jgi:hypothetical protein
MELKNITDKYWEKDVYPFPHQAIPVLRPLDALCYISECIASGHIFFGFDGFHLINEKDVLKRRPDQGLSIDVDDYEGRDYRDYLSDAGRILFSTIPDSDIGFEVVFAEGGTDDDHSEA